MIVGIYRKPHSHSDRTNQLNSMSERLKEKIHLVTRIENFIVILIVVNLSKICTL